VSCETVRKIFVGGRGGGDGGTSLIRFPSKIEVVQAKSSGGEHFGRRGSARIRDYIRPRKRELGITDRRDSTLDLEGGGVQDLHNLGRAGGLKRSREDPLPSLTGVGSWVNVTSNGEGVLRVNKPLNRGKHLTVLL